MSDKSLCADSWFTDGYGYHMTTKKSGCGNKGWNVASYNNGYAMCDLDNTDYLKAIIYEKIYNLSIENIKENINKNNTKTKKYIEKIKKKQMDILEKTRINDNKVISRKRKWLSII